jgi:hypothetical protein
LLGNPVKVTRAFSENSHGRYQRTLQDADIPTHPEEMKATYEFRVGKLMSVQATARITPAGIVAVGVTTLLVALAVSALTARRRRY